MLNVLRFTGVECTDIRPMFHVNTQSSLVANFQHC